MSHESRSSGSPSKAPGGGLHQRRSFSDAAHTHDESTPAQGASLQRPNPTKLAILGGVCVALLLGVLYRFGVFDTGEKIDPATADSSTLTPEQRKEYREIKKRQEEEDANPASSGPNKPIKVGA